MLWTALPLWRGAWPPAGREHPLFRWSLVVLALIFVQIVLGGFVAGLDAGLTYNTWPLMDDRFIPEGVYPSLAAPFEDVTTVQFNHRIMAYIVTAAVIALWFHSRRAGEAATTAHLFLAALTLQMLVGIWTLLAVVPIWLGALHQAGAVALLTAAIVHAFALKRL
jgi:cytochrome c oxidase assembly protein subunit 15